MLDLLDQLLEAHAALIAASSHLQGATESGEITGEQAKSLSDISAEAQALADKLEGRIYYIINYHKGASNGS